MKELVHDAEDFSELMQKCLLYFSMDIFADIYNVKEYKGGASQDQEVKDKLFEVFDGCYIKLALKGIWLSNIPIPKDINHFIELVQDIDKAKDNHEKQNKQTELDRWFKNMFLIEQWNWPFELSQETLTRPLTRHIPKSVRDVFNKTFNEYKEL